MEYFLVSSAFFFFLIKKRKILPNFTKKLKKLNFGNKFPILFNQANSLHLGQIENYSINVFKINSNQDLNLLDVNTDMNLYGGDTTAQLDYNLIDKAVVLKGRFSMRNRELVDYPNMCAIITIEVIFYSFFRNSKDQEICLTLI